MQDQAKLCTFIVAHGGARFTMAHAAPNRSGAQCYEAGKLATEHRRIRELAPTMTQIMAASMNLEYDEE